MAVYKIRNETGFYRDLKSEKKARKKINRMLQDSGWKVQNLSQFNPADTKGIALTEFTLDKGRADYLLLVDGKAVGVIEAKAQGTTLSTVAEQTRRYIAHLPGDIPHVKMPLPFTYESTGVETFFRDTRDPDSRSRRIFAFHQPQTLIKWAAEKDTLRKRLQQMPSLIEEGLWDCQVDAIQNLERSLTENRPRTLIQMATGTGKTFTAVNSIYRLIKFAKAARVLFLVDRCNLGRQALAEFIKYITPTEGRTQNRHLCQR